MYEKDEKRNKNNKRAQKSFEKFNVWLAVQFLDERSSDLTAIITRLKGSSWNKLFGWQKHYHQWQSTIQKTFKKSLYAAAAAAEAAKQITEIENNDLKTL